MIVRLFLVWALIALCAGAWIFYMNRKQREVGQRIGRQIFISGVISVIIIACLTLLNNIQGL